MSRNFVRPLARTARTLRYGTVPSLPLILGRSFTAASAPERNRTRISTIFAALLCVGVATTAYGIYDFYSFFTIWPEEVRGDLRAGVKAKNQGNLKVAEIYLRRAWETVNAIPVSALGSQPYLKLSGLGIVLAGVLEEHDLPDSAYEVYVDVIQRLQAAQKENKLTGPERMRAVSVACKLGEMAEIYHHPAEEEEKWLVWAVEELLKTMNSVQGNVAEEGKEEEAVRVVLAELQLPSWVTVTDIGAPIEALGAFYAKVGKLEYAMPLYLQAISLLIPPASQKQTSPEHRCRGAQLMNNLSDLIMRANPPTPEILHQAEAWAKHAASIIEKTKISSKNQPEQLMTCEYALGAVLFNLGTFREMAGDTEGSRKYYEGCLEQSKKVRMEEGITEAKIALRRLDRVPEKASVPGKKS